MSVPELAEEMKYFEQHRGELLQCAPGKFALIKDAECIGTFDSAENAYEEGARRFPGTAFLIQEILPEDPIQEMPAFYTGLLYADI
jgi:hypothetical protein